MTFEECARILAKEKENIRQADRMDAPELIEAYTVILSLLNGTVMAADNKSGKTAEQELQHVMDMACDNIKRAYRLGYSDGIEDAFRSVQEEHDRKKRLSQPWQA